MIKYLLDTNILVYLLNSDQKTIKFLRKLQDAIFYISHITWIETLAGSFHHKKSIKQLVMDLSGFVRIPLDDSISLITAQLIQRDLQRSQKKKIQDYIIGATSIHHKIPLVTNNPKDFRRFKKLHIISPPKT